MAKDGPQGHGYCATPRKDNIFYIRPLPRKLGYLMLPRSARNLGDRLPTEVGSLNILVDLLVDPWGLEPLIPTQL